MRYLMSGQFGYTCMQGHLWQWSDIVSGQYWKLIICTDHHRHTSPYTHSKHTLTTHTYNTYMYTLITHTHNTLTTHTHNTPTTHTHHTHSQHTLTTHSPHTYHTHSPHTHNTHSPHTLTTHTHHTPLTILACGLPRPLAMPSHTGMWQIGSQHWTQKRLGHP